MKTASAITAFAALAQETRLAVVRLLVQTGPDGLNAGDIATRLAVPASTLSHHLAQLERAGLLRSWRLQRQIFYACDYAGLRDLLAFLAEDCCQGRPDLCDQPIPPPLLTAPDHMASPPPRKSGASTMTARVYRVLFLCTHNSARSILAEGILNQAGKGRFVAYSAGSHPTGQINPHVLAMLQSLHCPTDGLRSKSWSEFTGPDAPSLDFVFTVCDNAAGEACPVWPGQPMTAHWGVPDPSSVQGSEAEKRAAVAEVCRMLHRRIGIFVNLPIASLDRLSLQAQLRDIGTRIASPEKETMA